MKYENFKISFNMRTPICILEYINFDSLLYFCKIKDILKEDFFDSRDIKQNKLLDIELDILDKKYGVYTSSVGFGEYIEFFQYWVKRFCNNNDDFVKFKNKRERINIGSGYFKSYKMPINLRNYKNVNFFIRGNKKEIERLISKYLIYVGKKSSQGFGEINSYIIENIKNDYSIFYKNLLMRPIPFTDETYNICLKNNINFQIINRAIKPPYWRTDCSAKHISLS